MNQNYCSATWRLIRLLLAAWCFFPFNFMVSPVQAQGIVFNGVTPTQATVAKWDKYEAVISLSAAYTNPYDYNDIAVQATFTSPTGVQRTVDAFWMQDYAIDPSTRNLSPTGNPGFRVRFTPDEPGQWSYVLTGRLQGGSPATSPTYTFTCSGTSATGKGFIRKTNSNYLRWDNGSQYIPIGENIAFPFSNIIQDYEYYLNKLEPVGVNFIRVWMATWGFGLEWTNGHGLSGFNGLKQYKQTAAKALDYLLDRGHTNGYATMVCINYHDQLLLKDSIWYQNPYNIINGGPCVKPEEFFTNATAREILKNRLRYLVARWGYSGSLQSWELFNEADNWPDYQSNISNVDQWHQEMAAYLKSIDPNHLVTTSFGLETNGNGTWNSASIDFTQTHKYKPDGRLPRLLSNLNQQRVNTFSKPTLNGEFGLSYDGSIEPNYDPYGIMLHNGMWTTLFSGAMGSAMPWWWDHWIDPKNLYGHYATLAAFKEVVPFQAGDFRKVNITYSNAGTAEAIIIPEAQWGNMALGDDFTIDNEGELAPGVDSLNLFIHGSFHPELRRPPTFHVNYQQNGTFVLVTDTVQSTARISIYVDGVLQLDQPAQVRATYTVPIPAGQHVIKVDNLGGDWALVVKYRFINAVGPFNTYVLKSADNNQAAGYILQRLYNFQYCLDNSNIAPPVVPAGTSISVPNMSNGNYTVNFYSCAPASTTTPAQPYSSITATATSGTLTFSLPEVAWDIAFTATLNTTAGAITAPVSVTPQAGWGATTAASFTISGAGTITPGASSLGMFIYGSQANTQYRNPPTFTVNYAQAGYFEVRTGAMISPSWPRVTVYVDGAKMLDQPAFINTSYVVTIPPGPHNIQVDNLGGDWTFVDHYSFVPSLAAPPPTPAVTANARTIRPGLGWGTKPPFNSFTLSSTGTLTPDTTNLSMFVYGSQANTQYRNPATFNVTFPQDGYFKLTTTSSISQNGASRVSIYVDGVLVTDQVAFTSLPYVVAVTAGTHNITVDNLGGDWFMVDAFVFDVLSP